MIEAAVAAMGNGPLTEAGLRQHVWPLFSRVRAACEARGEIYLANHSLGRPLDQTAEDVAAGINLWFDRLDGAWDDDAWPGEMDRFRERVAKLIGLKDAKAVVPKTSAGQGLRAVLNALPNRTLRIVATRGEFDSIDFILKAYADKGRADIRWVEPTRYDQGVPLFETQALIDAIEPGIDLVVVSHVAFTTGQVVADLKAVSEAAHAANALLLVDVYHAVGVLPVEMGDVDFLIGGSYKYTRGGPGACWLAIHPSRLGMRTLDTGWFAKESPFRYERPDPPRFGDGGDAWLESTPPVLTLYQAAAGQRLTLALGVARLREYNLRQQEVLRQAFRDHGGPCFQPACPTEFGAFALVPHSEPRAFSNALRAAGVNTDSRGSFVRFGPDLLNSDDELREAARITAEVGR